MAKVREYESKYIWHMKKITNMIQHTRIKFSQRPRMRTSTKLVMVFGIFSFISIFCLVFFFLNVSNKQTLGVDILPAPVVIDGKQEVLQKKLLSDFEVKQLDTRSYTAVNDTVVLFKKIKP